MQLFDWWLNNWACDLGCCLDSCSRQSATKQSPLAFNCSPGTIAKGAHRAWHVLTNALSVFVSVSQPALGKKHGWVIPRVKAQ